MILDKNSLTFGFRLSLHIANLLNEMLVELQGLGFKMLDKVLLGLLLVVQLVPD